MRKIVIAFVGLVFVGATFAAGVSERMNCADTKARIDSLAAQENLNDSDTALLADLRAAYRGKCMARTAGRGARAIAATRNVSASSDKTDDTKTAEVTPIVDASAMEDIPVADACTSPDANGCCPGEEFADLGDKGKFCCKDDACFPPMDVTVTEPEKTEEDIAAEITANIEKGLCGDGTKPNKYGCCAGEIFKDMGNAEFACCKKDSEECFPPIK